jgi:hypothetical protein
LSLEDFIQQAARNIGQMVALGVDDGLVNPVRRIPTTDAAWKDDVLRLCHECGYIVLIPENTEGTLWEIEQVLAERMLRQKVIFLNVAAAGRDHPFWHRDRLVYSEDDGQTFLRTVHRLIAVEVDTPFDTATLPPREKILCAAAIGGDIVLICAERLTESGLWANCVRIVAYMRAKAARTSR